MEEIAPMIIMPVMFAAIAYMIRIGQEHKRLKQLAEYQYNLHRELLDKFGSSQEMLEYLESDAGKKILELAPAEKIRPHARILSSIQAGIVVGLAGGAFYFMRNLIEEAYESFTFMGVLGIALGLGFVISAVVAFALSKSWGLINGSTNKLD
ncbi:MAG: hypothetical protein GY906_21490 [bacterium]|nr:hypothetical protein [bacterium]